ncbi:MAG: YbjN domain-containing protein [Trueperaceae bacterium]|nr:YbjN domain-containing protein [Trueperaceae bacterium]
MADFETVKSYLLDVNLTILEENDDEQLVVVQNEENGIQHLVVDCQDPTVVLEQLILRLPNADPGLYKRLLQMNRTLVHGAFALDDSGEMVLWRDTLQLANLDPNEIEASLDALTLALAEHGSELLDYAHANA